MKYYYIAVTTTEKGKNYSHVLKLSEYDNILARLKLPGIVSANICKSKKEAADLVTYWNNFYRANGTYLFDCPSF